MKVLVIGGGGREHSIVWALRKNPRVNKIICAPGNAGIAALAECFVIKTEDATRIAQQHRVDLVIVGPENPLAAGMADHFRAEGFPVVGPSQDAARIESSKIFCKKLLIRHGIPTADFAEFYQVELARKLIYSLNDSDYPVVIKADGLAAGKGVIIAKNQKTAIRTINDMMVREKLGKAGKQIIIEKFLTGRECSIIAAVDAKGNIVIFPPSRDYKRANNGDKGRNTGGMGAYSPLLDVTPAMSKKIREAIIEPVLAGLANEGCPYQGIIYFGLMIDNSNNIYVLEINCRFGDPETQVLLPLLESDFAEMMMATATGELANYTPQWSNKSAVCVVLASKGYPDKSNTGFPITGLDIAGSENTLIFHAGTAKGPLDSTVTDGGRVLGVVGLGNNQSQARSRAYCAAGMIDFNGKKCRRDIAA